tara:strand:+ start:818 stop:1189 length:372 start_codon:yes stop_codon:yes gene_type:complete
MKNEKIILGEKSLWELVENLNWSLDHDFRRIESELLLMDLDISNQIHEFTELKRNEIYSQYEEDWLGDPGIDVGDDGWSDLTAEVVGRGKNFYENISVKKLQQMVSSDNYHENFMYSFHFLYD